jgi:hypothetical protein
VGGEEMREDNEKYDPYAVCLVFSIWLQRKRKENPLEYGKFALPIWATRFSAEIMHWNVEGTPQFIYDSDILSQQADLIKHDYCPAEHLDPSERFSRSEDID